MNIKSLKIISYVVLIIQCLATLILGIAMANEKILYTIGGVKDSDITSLFVIPWTLIIPVIVQLGLSILFVILIHKLKGKSMRIAGIVIALVMCLTPLMTVVSNAAQYHFMGAQNETVLAAMSIVITMISQIVNPLMTLGAFGMVFMCGMMCCAKD